MPVRPTFPGVYIEEIPSGVHTIVGVATSIGAFIDYFARGPMNIAIHILSTADFEREFGGLDTLSEASYAIQQFFLNGGSEAYVIRTGAAGTFATAQIQLLTAAAGGLSTLVFEAGRLIKGVSVADPGAWGNFVRLDVDYDTTDPANLFNLTVSEVSPAGTQPVLRTETFRNLSMNATDTNFAVEVINEDSLIVQATLAAPAGRPAQTGTAGGPPNPANFAAPFQLNLQIDAEPIVTATLARAPAGAGNAQLQDARGLLEAAIRLAPLQAIPPRDDPRFSNATVQLIGGQYRILLGRAGATPGAPFNPTSLLTVTENGAGTTASGFGLAGAAPNVQQYTLGGATVAAQQFVQAGANGNLPDANDIIGVRASKTGIFALEDADLFNILCIPRAADLAAAAMFTVYSNAEAYCLERRAFMIMDIPDTVNTPQRMQDFLTANATLRNRNAAVYFPRTRIADPLNSLRLRDIASSGTMAGVYARTDNDRGVWKAPAGIDTTLRNVNELVYVQTDPENGVLNPLGINGLRNFAIFGNISWGARTLDGADVQASEWKYVPVRRFALFLEESLYRGTKFAVFEPNDEPLWAQIRLNVGAFLQNLFRQGAFQGQTPREAYFVKCDKETTTQNDIDQGIVNVLVGFAPLKPAEFVIIKISQIAGQIQV
jgi:phage tail sheath protein FI